MSFRNWLLTGTSLALLSLFPLSAKAEDAPSPALLAAYQAYVADQNDANKAALTEACTAAGFATLEDCLTVLKATVLPAPLSSEEPAPAPSGEATPPPSSEAAPGPSSEEPPPPSSEPPAPSSSAEPAAQPSSAAPDQPVSSSEEPAAAPAATQPESSSETAPAVASSSAEAPAASSAPATGADVEAKLTAAVTLYNQGVAELDAGKGTGQAKVDKAKARIDAICKAIDFADIDACLAQFGLTLNPLPPKPAPQPASSEAPAPSSEQPASEQPSSSAEPPISQLLNASEAVTPSAVEVLPSQVAPSEAAPILDSAKDQQNAGSASSQPPANQASSEPSASSEPPAPPPQDDKSAQSDIKPPPPDQQSTIAERGTKRTDGTPLVVMPPQGTSDVKIVETPKGDAGGIVFQLGINIFITNPEQERDRNYNPDEDQIFYEDLSHGRVRETILRHNGTRIVTIRNRNGDILQRSKILADGREIILASYDPREDDDLGHWRDPGDDLPPLRLTISASDYILDADSADYDEVQTFLDKPPVEAVRRLYSIDEVKRSARLRDSVRRLEVGGLTFDSGKATIARSQVGALQNVAKAMLALLDRNPGETFLIEGHTDAVGSDVSNLVLSDERAATVARILTDFYDIPAENLVTQGYGERYLKVVTQDPEPLNRRVTVKRITPLISYVAGH